MRDAEIKNQQGEHVFLQRGVEFPAPFSQLAVNVVASKYFYGDVAAGNGSPKDGQREYSFRQLAHRVAYTIGQAGLDQGYFDGESAHYFYRELCWLLVNQYGSFNSPVWFNVGLFEEYGIRDTGDKPLFGVDPTSMTHDGHADIVPVDPYERPQASACFIIGLEDSIEGIWQLMAESARLFKYGSGIGADWSKLRSTKDKLSGGGQPSGPVSFMQVQDSTGATIQSGATRLVFARRSG